MVAGGQPALPPGQVLAEGITQEDIKFAFEKHGIVNPAVLRKDEQGILTYKGIMTLAKYSALHGHRPG